MNNKLLTILLFFIISSALRASTISHSDFRYSHLGLTDGLTSQRVYSLVEGLQGEIWLSMKNGIARYNGRLLKHYQMDTPLRFSNAGGKTMRVMMTPQQQLLAYDNKGNIFLYHPLTDSFEPYLTHFTELFRQLCPQYYGLILNGITVDRQGWIWIATNHGIFVMISDEGEILHWNDDDYLNGVITCGDQVVVYTNAGAYLIQRDNGKKWLTLTTDHVLTAFHDDASGRLWLGTQSNGVLLYTCDGWKPLSNDSHQRLPHLPVRAIERMDESTMLLGLDGAGVYAVQRDGNHAFQLFSQDYTQGGVLHGNGIYALLRDREGNIWMGSYTGGVDIAYPTGRMIETFEHQPNMEQSLMNNGVNCLLQHNALLCFGTDGGLSTLNQVTGQWRHTLQGKVVLAICEDGADLLVGTYGDGVLRITPSGHCTTAFSREQGNLSTNYVYSVMKDKEGGLWIGCLDGPLVHFASTGQTASPRNMGCSYSLGSSQSFDIQTVECMVPTPDGKMAVGTANGFYVVDASRNSFTHYFTSEEFTGGDVNTFVKSILFSSVDSVWVATDGGGIYAYSLSSRTISTYTEAEGLTSNCVSLLAFDGQGRIIAGTDNGLSALYPAEGRAIKLIPGQGREYNRAATIALSDGRLMFGSTHGAVVVDPALIDRIDYQAPLRFTGIHIKGETTDEERVRLSREMEAGKLRLANSQRSLEIFFESICYRYSTDILYQYFLEGFNQVWNNPTAIAMVSYDNLPPGHYTLKVRTVSRNSGHVIDSRTLKVSVAQPWWNTFWAWLIYMGIMVTLMLMALRDYRGRLERKYFNEKINFFVNAAHEIRTPLSLVLEPLTHIAADSQLSDRSRSYLDIARTNSGKLQILINELLDFQKADVMAGSLKKVPVEVKTIMLTSMERFALLAQEKGLTMDMHCPEQLRVMIDINLFDKLFNNLLSNAIKYTSKGGKVKLSAWMSGDKVKIEVRDTGIGIPKSAHKMIFKSFYRAENAVKTRETGSGIGLMLAKRIVALHQGELTFESEEGVGTAFLITLDAAESSVQPEHVFGSQGQLQPNELASVELAEEAEESNNDVQPQEEPKESRDVILFVDDNADLRNYFSLAFGDRFTIATVENGVEALDFLREHECDLVVSDLMMPRMRGDELCRRIKENCDTSWLPVILLTAKHEKQLIIDGLQQGADDYMTKPFDTEILRHKIDSLLANRRRLSNYYRQRVEQMVAIEAESTAALDTCSDTEKKQVEEGSAGEKADSSSAVHHPMEGEYAVASEIPDEMGSMEGNAFIDKATAIVLEKMGEAGFGIDELCSEMAMSRTLLYGKLKSFTAQTPQDFIRTIRLQRAATLLSQGKNILEVSEMVGFANAKHFSTVFKKHFGVPPSKYERLETPN